MPNFGNFISTIGYVSSRRATLQHSSFRLVCYLIGRLLHLEVSTDLRSTPFYLGHILARLLSTCSRLKLHVECCTTHSDSSFYHSMVIWRLLVDTLRSSPTFMCLLQVGSDDCHRGGFSSLCRSLERALRGHASVAFDQRCGRVAGWDSKAVVFDHICARVSSWVHYSSPSGADPRTEQRKKGTDPRTGATLPGCPVCALFWLVAPVSLSLVFLSRTWSWFPRVGSWFPGPFRRFALLPHSCVVSFRGQVVVEMFGGQTGADPVTELSAGRPHGRKVYVTSSTLLTRMARTVGSRPQQASGYFVVLLVGVLKPNRTRSTSSQKLDKDVVKLQFLALGPAVAVFRQERSVYTGAKVEGLFKGT